MSVLSDLIQLGRKNGSTTEEGREREALRQQRQLLIHEVERLRSILRMSTSLYSSLECEQVLELALDLGSAVLSETGEGDKAIVRALLLIGETGLEIASSRGLNHSDLKAKLTGNQGALQWSLNRAETVICDNPADDPELHKLSKMHKCSTAVCVPLSLDMNVYGLLLYAHPSPDFFRSDRIELLNAVAGQAMIALQNAQLYQDLAHEKERMAETLEEARKKLARDLHDGPTQSVGAITMRVNFARRLMERDPKAASDELFRVEELSRRTCKEMRQMLFTLRPLVLESSGLIEALKHLAKTAQETYGQSVIVKAKAKAADELELGKQNVLFYVAEEAINNARKHAQAAHVWVRAKSKDDVFMLEIEDDGIGFDLKEATEGYEERGSLGLVNIYERAEIVSGLLKIDTQKGKGTIVKLAVPLTPEAADRIRRPGFVF